MGVVAPALPAHTLPDLAGVSRLAIIRLSSIGDVVHALPVSAALSDAFPNLQLTWIVEEMSAEIVTGNPCLHDVIVIPRARWKQGRSHSPRVWREYLSFLVGLRRRRFDVTLDLQGYAKSALLSLATGARHRIGWWRLRDGADLVSRAIPRRPESKHRVEWFLDVARALGAEPAHIRFPFAIPREATDRVRGLLRAGGIEGQYAVLNPAAGDHARRWGNERYGELANGLAERFGLPTVLVGSARDRAACDAVRAIAGASGGAVPVLPLVVAGETSLKELAAVLKGAAVHVCGDTGSAHIAAAVECPVIALYGPTDPCHAGPWAQQDRVLARRDLCDPLCTARACVFVDRAAAPRTGAPMAAAANSTRCLSHISVNQVLDRIGQLGHDRTE